jgi:hypothetical protein
MRISDFPLLVFVLSFVALWISAQIGSFFHKKLRPLQEEEWKDADTILGASLALLGLIIAFSFSAAIDRYNQRKRCEAEEANAIGTEYIRVEMLPAADATKLRELLRKYLDQRVLFYETGRARFYEAGNERRLRQIDADTARLETELWSSIRAAAAAQPTPITAVSVTGMNDVLNAKGYTQAAWWNRIPPAAWSLMAAIAVFCNLLLGYDSRRKHIVQFMILPLALSISFLLIADIDSPRGGLIHVLPQNLLSLSQSLHAP